MEGYQQKSRPLSSSCEQRSSRQYSGARGQGSNDAIAESTEDLTQDNAVFLLVLELYTRQQKEHSERSRRHGREGSDSWFTSGCGAKLRFQGGAATSDIAACKSSNDASGPAGKMARASMGDGQAISVERADDAATAAIIGRLREAWSSYPSKVEFYLPQLCIVAALGDFVHPACLIDYLLELCGADLRLAHKTHWFLKAFCSGTESESQRSGLLSFKHRVQQRGCVVAKKVFRALSMNTDTLPSRNSVKIAVDQEANTRDGQAAESVSTVRPATTILSPNVVTSERDVVVGSRTAATGDNITHHLGSWSPEAQAAVSMRPGAHDRVKCADNLGDNDGDDDDDDDDDDDGLAEHYDPAMFFVEALLGLAEELGKISSKKRRQGLQDGLERINEFFLSQQAQGSDVIYVPFGGVFHQIRAIHPQESMHFSTKERVPLLVCLEVQEVAVSQSALRPMLRKCASGMASTAGTAGNSPLMVGEKMAAKMMDRLRGTIRSFVKLKSDEYPDCLHASAGSARSAGSSAGASGSQDNFRSPVVDGSIEGDACSSRSNSDAFVEELHHGTDGIYDDRVSIDGVPAESISRTRSPAGNSEDDMAGVSSQGAYWYGDGGGLSALDAVMGQWGGDLEAETVSSGAVVDNDSQSTTSGIPRHVREDLSAGPVDSSALMAAGCNCEATDKAKSVPEEGEDDSWEIVDGPVCSDDATKLSVTGPAMNSDSQSDSYSEYIAAAEAEMLDREKLASAAEEELAKEVAAQTAAAVPRPGRRRHGRGRGGNQPRIIFKERWSEKEDRVWQAAGDTGHDENLSAGDAAESRTKCQSNGWKLLPIIVKANDDVRQEQFVSQLVAVFDSIFRESNVGARLRPYEIMATSPTTGIIEAIPDTVSLDALRRHAPHLSLAEFFRRHFGRRGLLREARSNFVESCAAYSIVCYLLQIKDRHNGNLLLSADGHLVHIDWGFALELSPGGNLGFESAPFKLTHEFVEVMGGTRSTSFQTYRSLCVRAFLEARRRRDKIIMLVGMMTRFKPDLVCFAGRTESVLKNLRSRFQPDLSADECVTFVHDLIEQSVNNWRTRWFDKYQRAFVGIQ